MSKKITIVSALDPNTFQPKIGVKLPDQQLVVFDAEQIKSYDDMVKDVKALVTEDLYDEVDQSFKEYRYRNFTINDYQDKAIETAIYGSGYAIVYPTLGIAGESGEVADKVKKILRDNNGEFTDEKKLEIAKEIGDVCWYIAALCRDLGFSMAEVCQMNLDKLASRKARNKISGSGDDR